MSPVRRQTLTAVDATGFAGVHRTKLEHFGLCWYVSYCVVVHSEPLLKMPQDRNLLVGAKEIAEYFYGDASMQRRVYHLFDQHRQPHRFPMFKAGSVICARKSEIDRWIAEREAASNDNRRDKPDAA